MNPLQAPNIGPGGKDFGNREKNGQIELQAEVLSVIKKNITKPKKQIYNAVKREFPELSSRDFSDIISELI
jgi:hypothetical protein